MKIKLLVAVAFCFLYLATSVFAQRTLIHAGNVLDVKSGNMSSNMTIVVQGNKIVALEQGYTNPRQGDTVIDMKNRTVMPGLIDMHVHLETETSKDGTLMRFTSNEADVAYRSTMFARKTLDAGFTTVRDLGGSNVNSALRNALNA